MVVTDVGVTTPGGNATAKLKSTVAPRSTLAPAGGIVRMTSPAGISSDGSPVPIRYFSRRRPSSDIATPSGCPTVVGGTLTLSERRNLTAGVEMPCAMVAPRAPVVSRSRMSPRRMIAVDEPAWPSCRSCPSANTDETPCLSCASRVAAELPASNGRHPRGHTRKDGARHSRCSNKA